MDLRRLSLIVVALVACVPKTAPPEAVTSDDPWSQASLDRALDEVLPLVEAQAGRPFLRRPTVAAADQENFHALLVAEQRRIYAQVLPDTPESVREDLATAAGEFMTSGILGKYILETETVYICPNALVPAMLESGLDLSRGHDVAKVVVAHEITHALEDQYTDLEQVLDELEDEEALFAASGAWEGFATLVEERVSAQLGLTDVYQALISMQGWGPSGLVDPGAWRTWAIYGQGRDFMAWHDARGGTAATWATLEDPPSQTSVLFRPHTWTPDPPAPNLDYAAVLRGLEVELGDGEWLITNTRLGEFELRYEASMAGNEDQLDAVLGHVVHAQRLDAAQPERTSDIRLVVFDEPRWARAWLDLVRTQHSHDAFEVADLLDLPVEVEYGVFDQIPADAAFLRTETIPLDEGLLDEKHAAWILRGDTLVTVQATSFSPEDRLGRAAELAFDRIEAARMAQLPPSP